MSEQFVWCNYENVICVSADQLVNDACDTCDIYLNRKRTYRLRLKTKDKEAIGKVLSYIKEAFNESEDGFELLFGWVD